MYRSGGKAKEGEEEEEEIQIFEKDQDDWENTQIEDPEDKFHTFLTEDDDYQFDLPKFIKLDDPFPKENPMMQKGQDLSPSVFTKLM